MLWHSTYFIKWSRRFGRWKVRVSWRRKDGLMGRFGGGWNWRLGVQVGGTTVLVNLLVMSVAVSRLKERGVA